MHRRSVLAHAGAVIAVASAGCSDLQANLGMGGGHVDESFSGSRQFSVEEGETVELSIEAEEVDDAEADQGSDDVERRSISVSVTDPADENVFAESVEAGESEAVELEIDRGGEYNIAVSGGTAHVTVETV